MMVSKMGCSSSGRKGTVVALISAVAVISGCITLLVWLAVRKQFLEGTNAKPSQALLSWEPVFSASVAIAGLGFHMIIHFWIILIIDNCARASLVYFKHNLTFTLILYVLYYCTPSGFFIIANCQSQWLSQQVIKGILKITFL